MLYYDLSSTESSSQRQLMLSQLCEGACCYSRMIAVQRYWLLTETSIICSSSSIVHGLCTYLYMNISNDTDMDMLQHCSGCYTCVHLMCCCCSRVAVHKSVANWRHMRTLHTVVELIVLL